LQKLNKEGTELVLLALHGVRGRLTEGQFKSYWDLAYADEGMTNVEETRDNYWKWWQRDPAAFFSHVKPLRDHILLEIVQWSKEF
jgi:hypothetical protein